MKSRFFAIVLLLAVIAVGFGACGGKEKKSSAKDITAFSEGGVTWTIDGTTITGNYPKGKVVTSLTPSVTVSDKADYEPKGPQNFTNSVTYTVTAEDGSTKAYTATAVVAEE